MILRPPLPLLVRAVVHRHHHVRISCCARRALSGSSGDKNNARAEAPTNSLWLSDLRDRLARGIATKQAAGAEEAARELRRRRDELDGGDWLPLLAGCGGFLMEARWRGLDGQEVAWGDMDSMGMYHGKRGALGCFGGDVTDPSGIGHVNNVVYNRYAESGRINWFTKVASQVSAEKKGEFAELMTPRGLGLILASIRTDYKFPIKYPDKVTVLHKLATRPTDRPDRVLMEAVAISHRHKRTAARFVEDIAAYDYRAGRRAELGGAVVEELERMYELQKRSEEEATRRVRELERVMDGLGV